MAYNLDMSKKKKYYVVWEGHDTGVFTSWEACKGAIEGYNGAKYKSFSNLSQAEYAFEGVYDEYVGKNTNSKLTDSEIQRIGRPNLNAIAVDAACSGNPGLMEYQGVDINTKNLLFKMGPFDESTNNIGEFLALVHAAALLKKKGDNRPIYSDSITALAWVRKKKCFTKLPRTEKNFESFALVDRAEEWLRNNKITNPIVKWETQAWGEIPADFGRK
jgi:ribonuclease HI